MHRNKGICSDIIHIIYKDGSVDRIENVTRISVYQEEKPLLIVYTTHSPLQQIDLSKVDSYWMNLGSWCSRPNRPRS